MKWNKYASIQKQYPWIRKFIGTLEMNTNRKNGIWDATREKQGLRDWVKNNLDRIVFNSPDSLGKILKEDNYVVDGLEMDRDKNIYYPHWVCGIFYVLYHEEGGEKFSKKYCLNRHQLLGETMDWLQEDRLNTKKLFLDGVIEMVWSARTVSGKIQQKLDIWLLPENFKL